MREISHVLYKRRHASCYTPVHIAQESYLNVREVAEAQYRDSLPGSKVLNMTRGGGKKRGPPAPLSMDEQARMLLTLSSFSDGSRCIPWAPADFPVL